MYICYPSLFILLLYAFLSATVIQYCWTHDYLLIMITFRSTIAVMTMLNIEYMYYYVVSDDIPSELCEDMSCVDSLHKVAVPL